MPKKLKKQKSLTTILEDVKADIQDMIKQNIISPYNKDEIGLKIDILYKKHKARYPVLKDFYLAAYIEDGKFFIEVRRRENEHN